MQATATQGKHMIHIHISKFYASKKSIKTLTFEMEVHTEDCILHHKVVDLK